MCLLHEADGSSDNACARELKAQTDNHANGICKEQVMTKEEAKEFLDKIGVKVDEITDDIAAEVAEWKSGLDAETRRAVRPYWITISVIAFVLGCGVGHLFF